MLVALKLYYGVDDMLQYFRSGECPFLVYVSYKYYRYAAAF